MRKKVRFYTLAPLPHPYILLNANRPKIYIPKKYKEKVESIILDAGVEIFRDPKVKDYPKGHIEKLISLHEKLKKIFTKAEIWVTVPDYPDDYHPRNLWVSEEKTNIERTLDNVLQCTSKYQEISWLIPIQGWNKTPESVRRSVKGLRNHGILKQYDYFGIANLCVENDLRIVYQTVKLVHKLLPEKKLHVFGLKLRGVPLVKDYIFSFDSMAWTRPLNKTLKTKYGNFSWKTTEQAREYFKVWLERLNYYLSQSSLSEFKEEKRNE